MFMRFAVVAIVFAVAVISTAFDSVGPARRSAPRTHVTVQVRPAVSLLAQPMTINVSGLRPGGDVTLKLTSTDSRGTSWASSARFHVGLEGAVDPATSPSVVGSYTGVQSMGLLDALQATFVSPASRQASGYYWDNLAPAAFHLTAVVAGRTVATTTFRRRLFPVSGGASAETITEDGFIGEFWYDRNSGRHPAILDFGGSEGGYGALSAAALAAAGYPTLNLAYFEEPGLPPTLSRIPLEYFARALRWLASQSDVNPKEVYVMGASYGTEAALLLGVHYPGLVYGVIATSPNSVVTCSYPRCNTSAWSLHGQPLPYTRYFDTTQPPDNPNAVIPVEDIKGPVFLACGGQDQDWTSCNYSDAIMSRLTAHNDPYVHVLYEYPDAGHGVDGAVPHEPGDFDSGNTPDADQVAIDSLWPHLLAFLRQTATAPRTPVVSCCEINIG